MSLHTLFKQAQSSHVITLALCAFVLAGGAFLVGKQMTQKSTGSEKNLAAAYFSTTTTTEGLREEFQSTLATNSATVSATSSVDSIEKETEQDKIHIAILPGHEPGYGGAVYDGMYERKMNLHVAKDIKSYLTNDDAFQVTMLRDGSNWHPRLQEYFENNKKTVQNYVDKHEKLTQNLLDEKKLSFVRSEDVFHGDAPDNVAYRLYAINHWASKQTNIDLLINIHFNDTASRNIAAQTPAGFAIYVPHHHYSNYEPSRDVAEYIFNRLNPWYAVSNNRQEKEGIIPDHKLIALGADNTLEPASILMEYGYIYEYRFDEPEIRDMLYDQMAFQTYRGIRDFFEGRSVMPDKQVSGFDKRITKDMLPISIEDKDRVATLLLQALLKKEGVYPPPDEDLRMCGLDGMFGSCTQRAVERFQSMHNLEVDGIVGQETLKLLYDTNSKSE